jgi:hydroxymethylpyrimidine pyrophosphatase-like HAD family hydrolase
MDKYLQPNESLIRLTEEYKKYGSIVVAFDFDGTVYDFHKKGDTYPNVIELLRNLKSIGCYLICWTANEDSELVINYLTDNSIPFDAINENPPFFPSKARKIYHNVLLDDRAGLLQVYNELSTLYKTVNDNNKSN